MFLCLISLFVPPSTFVFGSGSQDGLSRGSVHIVWSEENLEAAEILHKVPEMAPALALICQEVSWRAAGKPAEGGRGGGIHSPLLDASWVTRQWPCSDNWQFSGLY